MSKVVAPGEVVLSAPPQSGQLRLGPGLVYQAEHVVATRAGVLRQTGAGSSMWLESRLKRYIPSEGDVVLGTVIDRHGENFSVDIGGPFLAQLPQLSFEGATRRNRPPIKAGDVVYARVVEASRDAEPVLSCTDALGRASGFGHLKDGMTFSVNSLQARALLSSPPPPVLQALGATLRFELAVGLNGRVWVCAAADPEQPSNSHRTATLVAAAVTQSEFLTEQQTQTLVARLISRAKLS